jgi:hypothetical protein
VRDGAGLSRVVVAPPSADLARLLAVSRALVTVNSTVALDALLVGVPTLVVDLPSNLSPFVDAQVMLGAETATGIAASLAALVAETPARAALLEHSRQFLDEFEIRADGRAAERARDAIVGLAPPAGCVASTAAGDV